MNLLPSIPSTPQEREENSMLPSVPVETPPPGPVGFILLENGEKLLLETEGRFALQSS